MLGARYRDVPQIIRSLVQVVFFMTPSCGALAILAEPHRYLVYFNPFYSFIEMIRAPLLGTTPDLINLAVVLGVTLIGAVMCARIFIPFAPESFTGYKPMASIDLENVCVDFPVYNVNARSVKKRFLRLATGGTIVEDANKHVLVNALKDLACHCAMVTVLA